MIREDIQKEKLEPYRRAKREDYSNSLGYAACLRDRLWKRRKCRSPVCWAKVGKAQLLGLEVVQEKTKKIIQIKQTIQAARNRQQNYADLQRKMMEFWVGDSVMLKILPWKRVVRFGKREKLNPRYVRPFKVLEKVGSIAYKLELPEELSRDLRYLLIDKIDCRTVSKIGMIESKHKLRVDQEELETVFANWWGCKGYFNIRGHSIVKKAILLGANESLKLMNEVLALCEKVLGNVKKVKESVASKELRFDNVIQEKSLDLYDANGEVGNDVSNDNLSWNCGHGGHTYRKELPLNGKRAKRIEI
nr:putative reverse transcriptase domain-containing protein [Tanacetum cinerariifolium]